MAGYLHDIGKITIPAEILAKPGRLSDIEYDLIKGHAQASHDVLSTVDFPWPVAQIALQHHERMDGSGYPQGLKGEEPSCSNHASSPSRTWWKRCPRTGPTAQRLASNERWPRSNEDAARPTTRWSPTPALHLFRDKGFSIPE